MADKFEVILTREQHSHTSTYDEFLCIEKFVDNKFELSLRVYDALAEYAEYCDDDGEFMNPSEIDGKEVIAVEDGYIIGGDLSIIVEKALFASPSEKEIVEWLKSVSWDEAEINTILQRLPI